MNHVEIELQSGHRVVGDPTVSGREGLRLVDADGALVHGVQDITIGKTPTAPATVRVGLLVARTPSG